MSLRQGQRVVITGVGVVTPLGLNVESFWQALLAGRSGIDYISLFDTSNLPVKIAGEIKDFDPVAVVDRRLARRTGRFAQFSVAAAQMALADAGLAVDEQTADSIGIVLGSTGGLFDTGDQIEVLKTRGAGRLDPLFLSRVGAHMVSCRIGRLLGVTGPNSTVNSACASASDALGQAMNLVRLGHSEIMIAGGAESVLTPLAVGYLSVVGALSRRNGCPQQVSRPFDRERDGFVLGEGAGVLILESEEHARRRGARILAELAGAGWSFDAYDDTAPDAVGQSKAMIRALSDAQLRPEQVDYVNAHGTSTPLNDKAETAAIKMALGERARHVPVSSIKSMIGHLAAAAGGVEAVACVLAIKQGVVPPTINYEHPDPDCDLDYVPNEPREVPVSVCLSNSFGLGGQNACVVIKRYC